MKPHNNPWQRLVKKAQSAPEPESGPAPYAFATRVAARAFEGSAPDSRTLFMRVSLNAFAVAVLIMAATIAVNLRPVMTNIDEDVASLTEDLDLGDGAL
jgi:hypothetical protein